MRNFKGRLRFSDLFDAVRASKDPPSFMALFEDSTALIGLGVAFIGTWSAVHWDMPRLDGVGSIFIGLLLAATSILLARETKGLLIGEAADPLIVTSLMKIAEAMDGVAHANGIITVHLAPHQIIVALSLEFADELRTPEIELKVSELEDRLRRSHPEVIAAFVKPQSAAGYAATLLRRFGPPHKA
jgi:divalent metal cation (Fe/Co/Zn/Cd) transporter